MSIGTGLVLDCYKIGLTEEVGLKKGKKLGSLSLPMDCS